MKVLKASSPEELPAILDYVHDRNYDLSKVEHNAREQTVTIAIALRSTKKGERKFWFPFGGETSTQGKLVVRKALGFKLIDKARIGQGDINTIGLEGSQIIIKGGIPVEVLIEVEGFQVELLLPDDAKLE